MASGAKVRLFLDTNVIFSGLYSSRGAPSEILELYLNGKVGLVVSRLVLDELVVTLKKKFPDGLESMRRLLTSVPPEIVPDPSQDSLQPWLGRLTAGDAAIIAAAANARPDYFITGDNHFLKYRKIKELKTFPILTPGEFLSIFQPEAK
jgi:predicted nucleic acid-binding protein